MSATRILMRWLMIAAIAFFVGALGFFTYYFTLGGGSTPVLTLNPILYMTELDENGQPIDPGTVIMPINHGPRTQAEPPV